MCHPEEGFGVRTHIDVTATRKSNLSAAADAFSRSAGME